MILLWGLPGDSQIAVVREALSGLQAPYFFFNQHEVLQAELTFEVGQEVTAILQVEEQTLDLSEVTAAYLRPYDSRLIPAVAEAGMGSPEQQRAAELDDALCAWTELTPALVVNRMSAMAPNSSKPFQAQLIQACGFQTPDTLITTDPQAVREFAAQHGTIIYKSISSIRSIVSRVSTLSEERLASVRSCPTQFQQYVPGKDYRVHVVGQSTFVARIVSTADDYRYPSRQGGETTVEPAEVTPAVAERCIKMAQAMNLPVAGIDLRQTPAGEWFCFEVNPSPGFTYYQDACGFKMDEAIARLLLSAESMNRHR